MEVNIRFVAIALGLTCATASLPLWWPKPTKVTPSATPQPSVATTERVTPPDSTISSPGPIALPYNLANIEGLDIVELPEAARKRLASNGFVVTPPTSGSMPDLYRGNSLPFITVDSVTEVFLSEFEVAWSELEEKNAARFLELQSTLWNELLSRAHEVPQSSRAAFTRTLGIVAVARLLATPDWPLPAPLPGDTHGSVRAEVLSTVQKIVGGQGVDKSHLWNREIDWSLFKPTGLYNQTKQLSRYYRSSQWWCRQGFRATVAAERECATILTWAILESSNSDDSPFTSGILGSLSRIERSFREFVGPPADTHFCNRDYVAFFRERIDSLPKALDSMEFDNEMLDLLNSITPPTTTQDDRQIYLLSTCRTLPSLIFDTVTHSGRTLPRSLDLMAALGSQRARELSLQSEDEGQRRILSEAFDTLENEITKADSVTPQRGIQTGIRELCLAMALPHPDERIPEFMKTPAYRDRGLAAAMATWSAARELYGLRIGWKYKVGGISTPPPGLIESNLDAWQRLIELAVTTSQAFSHYDIDMDHSALDLAIRFRRMAEKQLRGEVLSHADRTEFQYYSVRLDNSIDTKTAADSSDVDRRVCVPIGRSRRPNLTRFAGKVCQPIFAVYESDGKLYLVRGGVFGYREFDRPSGVAIDRQDFQQLMDSNNPPPASEWTESYIAR